MPTILDAVGIPAPVEVNGIAQKPIEGYSMFNTFNDPDGKTGHDTQYFDTTLSKQLALQNKLLGERLWLWWSLLNWQLGK